jgi:predicted peroxiredoxin
VTTTGRTIAIVATRGTSNNLFQVATLVRAATALEMGVRVLFKDEAAQKLHKDRIKVPEWAAVYARVEPQLMERLRAADFEEMDTFLRDAKEHGDDVEFWVAQETLDDRHLELADLIDLIDGAIAEATFRELADPALALLTF